MRQQLRVRGGFFAHAQRTSVHALLISKKIFADGTETAKNAKVFRYTVARTYIHVHKLYYTIYTYYNYYYTRWSKPQKKSGHWDIACISGIIPENPGWLAGMYLGSRPSPFRAHNENAHGTGNAWSRGQNLYHAATDFTHCKHMHTVHRKSEG